MPIDYEAAQRLLEQTFIECEDDLLRQVAPEIQAELRQPFETIFASRTQSYREGIIAVKRLLGDVLFAQTCALAHAGTIAELLRQPVWRGEKLAADLAVAQRRLKAMIEHGWRVSSRVTNAPGKAYIEVYDVVSSAPVFHSVVATGSDPYNALDEAIKKLEER